MLASIKRDWGAGDALVTLSAVRILLVPWIVVTCLPYHVFISHDVLHLATTCVLAVSNGYLGSVPIIMAATRVPDSQRELAGKTTRLSNVHHS